jgi:uncharacterized protein (DUF4213/DUF364 family)
MKIIESLLGSLNYGADGKDIRQGPFQTAVVSRFCGLAATPHETGPHYERTPVKEAGGLKDKSVNELAQMARSSSPHEAAIGMATINSLVELDDQRCVELNAGRLLAEKGRDRKVALVGHFPFVPELRQAVGELWVIERQPQEDDFPEEQAEEIIPGAQVVGITGTAFTNHTIDQLLALCAPEAYIVVLGGTAPLSPVLFDYGVSAICGTRVIDQEMVLHGVSQGATFRQLKGIRLLSMMR